MIDIYVQRVIEYFQETEAEPGFYVHEEKEAGSNAVFLLVCAEPEKYFNRYIEFLKAIDLEHTVAQHDNVSLLKKVLTGGQLIQLQEVLSTLNGGEYTPDA